MTHLMLKKASSLGAWQWDNTNNRYYLEIGGVKIAEIDSNGNMIIKGRYLTQ